MAAMNQKLPTSPAADALGFGAALQAEVKGEGDEERKKRMAQMALPQTGAYGAAASMLLGTGRGGGLGGL